MRNYFILLAFGVAGCTAPHGATLPNTPGLQSPPMTSQEKAVQEKAAAEVAKLRVCTVRWSVPESFDILDLRASDDAPAQALYDMGLDALPVLAQALSDTTETAVIENPNDTGHGSKRKVWKVNGLAARLIQRIAQHEFVLDNSLRDTAAPVVLELNIQQRPDSMTQFQRLVLDWYQTNRNRTLAQRKIADVDDSYFRNRLDAVAWLGQHKTRAAAPTIVSNAERTLQQVEQRHDSSSDNEMAEIALALGQIGDSKNLPVVRKLCDSLVAGTDSLYSQGINEVVTPRLFMAFHGLALLGDKTPAIEALNGLYARHQDKATERDRRKYQEALQAARQW